MLVGFVKVDLYHLTYVTNGGMAYLAWLDGGGRPCPDDPKFWYDWRSYDGYEYYARRGEIQPLRDLSDCQWAP